MLDPLTSALAQLRPVAQALLPPPELRWSRGCGSGIGLSAHKNAYPPTTLVNTFLEDRAAAQQAAAGTHYLGFGEKGLLDTTTRACYARTAEEYQAALLHCKAERQRDALREVWRPVSSLCACVRAAAAAPARFGALTDPSAAKGFNAGTTVAA